MSNDLKMSMAGFRNWSTANIESVGSLGYYWSSNPSSYTSTRGFMFDFTNSSITLTNDHYRASGFSVRCFKN